MIICSAVTDLRFGDCAKGKVVYNLAKNYDIVLRHCGSQNAGHTIFHNNIKHVTHIIPTGIFWNKTSIIGPQCMLNVPALFDEIKELEKLNIDVVSNLKIDYRAHIITDKHLKEDSNEIRIGTTRRGVGQCATDKFARIGTRAEDIPLLKQFLIDCTDYFYSQTQDEKTILCEGAQGYYLTIDSKYYPYVTSADVTLGSVIASGIPPQSIKSIYGVAKAYDTYVGTRKFQPTGAIFNKIADCGHEYGATTGRRRQCNWLNLDELIQAALVSGTTHIIINKIDVLELVGVYKLIHNKDIKEFSSIQDFKDFITHQIKTAFTNRQFSYPETIFSDNPYTI
ncbi:hypothetical protein CMI47_12765 [Candidatus Pacearchaeota archaeon]|nr:hypothetical protein [Candidatus Pacearchaeota archaeon]|tara:strand:+ start:59215 stop:60228 length:1014 start_codon:yes stop_codon:yes gene_type:complete